MVCEHRGTYAGITKSFTLMSLLGIIYCYECTGVVVVVMAVFAYGGCGAEDVVVLDVAEAAETGLTGVPHEDVIEAPSSGGQKLHTRTSPSSLPLRILSSPKVTVVTARR